MNWIDDVLRDVAELPDRNSPADWPEAMLVTAPELRQILETHWPEPTDALLQKSCDSAWARFCGVIGTGPDAPYPGMIEAFEAHYGQSFADKEWRTEAACWAAAWKRATEQASNIKPYSLGEHK